MSIAANIRRLRKQSGLTQEEFGRIADVSSMAVSQWENGRAVPRMGAVELIANHFKISKGELINDAPSFGLPVRGASATVPLVTLGTVHAGPLSDEMEGEDVVEVPASVLASHPDARALRVAGDCMNNVVLDGYHVLFDPATEPRNGSVVIARVGDVGTVMRRWVRGGSTLLLVADSTESYEDIVVTGDDTPVEVLGTVVWAQSEVTQ